MRKWPHTHLLHHEQLSKYFFSNLEDLTSATGNQVDASGKSFFEYTYEMFDKVELSFEPICAKR